MSWWRPETSDKDYSAYSSDLSRGDKNIEKAIKNISSSSSSSQEVGYGVFAGMSKASPRNMLKYTFQQCSRSKWIEKQIDKGQEFSGTF